MTHRPQVNISWFNKGCGREYGELQWTRCVGRGVECSCPFWIQHCPRTSMFSSFWKLLELCPFGWLLRLLYKDTRDGIWLFMMNSTCRPSPLPVGKGAGLEFQPLNEKLFSLSTSSHPGAVQEPTNGLLFRIVELSILGHFRGVCWLWHLTLCQT